MRPTSPPSRGSSRRCPPHRPREDRVLASHEGTTLQAILDACRNGVLRGDVVVVISNNHESGALRRARWPMTVERLGEWPGDRLDPLIAESEQHGLAFVRRLADEWTDGTNRFDRPGEALFVNRIAGRIVGVCGLNVDPYTAEPNVGRVRHLYVLSPYRRLGVGRALVSDVVDAARGRFRRLRLRTGDPGAAHFYETLGFRPEAHLGDCTHIMDVPR
jgi:GNAT superfamily N-acetyltransferase